MTRFSLLGRCLLHTVLLQYISVPSGAQIDFATPGRGVAQMNVKLGGYGLLHGGFGFSAGIGFWSNYNQVQPGCNLSVNLVGSKANVGNRDRYLTNWQLNTVLTPMLTFGVGGGRGLYQEINPFYFGTAGAVYANYRYSVTVGSNFVVMPRGVGDNIATARNRTQQLIYLGLRGGTDQWDLNLNIYEDFFGTDNAALQGLADNFDRFYTGGGNLQFRTSSYKIKQYADIYTGNFPRDLFDSPDLYHLYENDLNRCPDDWIGVGKARRHPRYVAQDPGQKLFNKGRNIIVVEWSPGALQQMAFQPSLQAYIGWQGGLNQMIAQNLIHNTIKINKVNPRVEHPDELQTNPALQERLHHFYPATQRGRFVVGGGLLLNTIPSTSPN